MAKITPKIGLEIHGYLVSNEKLFCSCKAEHGAKLTKPNTNICPICTGQPGAKPQKPNAEALNNIIQIALMLNCKVNEKLIWQRKHYSWPDLPKGYQNTISGTYAIPVGTNGKFEDIGITEVHIEEDPASWNPDSGEIDYNRSGLPLVEIVTEPDFSSSEQVGEWLKVLLHTLSYIKAIDKNLGIKADVNVSIKHPRSKHSQRVELKNINSIQNILAAIEVEVERQTKLEKGVEIQETRAFDAKKLQTKLMRTKEQAADYRFISDPDLPRVILNNKDIKKVQKELPPPPKEKVAKLIKQHKLDDYTAGVLTKKLDIAEFFETVVKDVPVKLATPWITVELLRVLNHEKKDLADPDVDIKPEHFITLLKAVEQKKITELKAKEILNSFVPVSHDPTKDLSTHAKVSDEGELKKWADAAMKENPQAVKDFKEGKQASLNFLVGAVMKASNKRADFAKVRAYLLKELN